MLSALQKERYARNIVIESIGERGQEALLRARVLVVGAGGLGSPVCLYLAAAGVGTIAVMDNDSVSLSNLQRQILHRTKDLGKLKVLSAAREMSGINPDTRVVPLAETLTRQNARDLVMQYDVAVSAVDNFAARYLLNDACVAARKPLVEAGVSRFDAVLMTVLPGLGPCYRCVFPDEHKLSGATPAALTGVVGAVAGLAGCFQALEVIKLITQTGVPLSGRLVIFEGLEPSWREIKIERSPNCAACGARAADA